MKTFAIILSALAAFVVAAPQDLEKQYARQVEESLTQRQIGGVGITENE